MCIRDSYDAYNVFPYNSQDEVMVLSDEVTNFIGVKVGDILGHANPHNLGGDALTKSSGTLEVFVSDVKVEQGEAFELKFSSNNFNEIVSYQMGLNFDPTVMDYSEATKSEHPKLANAAIGETDAENGNLRVSWFNIDGEGLTVNQEEKMFSLKFVAQQDIDNILDFINFGNKSIITEAHNTSLERLEMTLNVEEGSLSTAVQENQIPEGFALSQNAPNPFNDITEIRFELPRSMKAEVEITNVLGETVKTISKIFNQGENIISLTQKEIGAGVFHYTLKSEDVLITKSMISLN